ncbi:MAG: sensor histidine kinase, partial [Gammaproteobacteria bacterium]|nr:sensor histidine kinase [Gammaproteobacteria bacterium]
VYSLGALGACESRIQAMSMVHKRLYQSNDFTSIDMKILFDEISGALFKESDFDYIELDIQANDISLEMDAAIPCAMIINELLSNSLKYAFKDGQSGKISICMDVIKGGMYCLCVCDTGVGLSEDIFMGEAETLGLQLVNVFVDQLGGELEVHRKDGVAFKVIFPAGKTTNV